MSFFVVRQYRLLSAVLFWIVLNLTTSSSLLFFTVFTMSPHTSSLTSLSVFIITLSSSTFEVVLFVMIALVLFFLLFFTPQVLLGTEFRTLHGQVVFYDAGHVTYWKLLQQTDGTPFSLARKLFHLRPAALEADFTWILHWGWCHHEAVLFIIQAASC